MEVAARKTPAAEWRDYWPLTLAAMVGYSIIGLQSYAFGPFVASLEQEFGWTRAQAMLGVSVSNGVGVFLNILIGMIVDRLGPRRVGLTGLFVKGGSFALLATATGTLLNWSLLWGILAVGVVLVQSTVWTKAVAGRFDQSRGLAMAVVLSGTPITAMIAPVLGTFLIENYGWRVGFVGVGLSWVAVSFPIVFFLFREGNAGKDVGTGATAITDHPGLTLREGIRTRAFIGLLISFGAFSFYNMAIATNLVPLLSETGISPMEAAGIASIMGLAGIIARLLVGFLLDRWPGNIIGMTCQFLPVLGCAILLLDAPSVLLLSVAVASFGVATGAEVDAALYLATRHFGLKAFASLFGAIITFGAVNAAISPYVAGWLHDTSGTYDLVLMVIMVVMTIGAIAIGATGRPRNDWAQGSGR
jgi:MFS family permease